MNLQEFNANVCLEYDKQLQRFGFQFDDLNTKNDWCMYICDYATKWARGERGDEEGLIKVAALAFAALQARNRNHGFHPRHYDQ